MIRFRKLIRYAGVSVIATTISQAILATLNSTRATSAGWANVIATMVGTVPSFELNRRWVWRKTGRRSLGAEVVPFVTIAAAGLGLSTLAAIYASHWADGHGYSNSGRTILIAAATLTAFGLVWIAQFIILDKVLFGRNGSTPAGEAEAVADAANGVDQGRVLDVDLVA
ncbi:MAG TPA: GtrA family protein [Ilumatobacteraceae bacterium]|jgi:putative flippase GtrA